MRVPAQAYDFSASDIEQIVAAIRTLLGTGAYLTLGDHVVAFEREFGAHHRSPYAIAVSSGTAALEIILRALDVAGGEVILPTNTFAATAFAVIAAGARPVFADIQSDLTTDPASIAAEMSPKTRAVVTVHIGGLISPATVELLRLCRRHGVPLVEDAAHAHGATLAGRFAGEFGVAAAFSFFSTKVMTTGEGGMILTADARIRDAAVILRDQAKVDGANYHERIGYNWRLTELQAILGRVQLPRLVQFIERRRQLAAIYDAALAGVGGVKTITRPVDVGHNFYKYICFVENRTPLEVRQALKERGVALGGNVYDTPLHEQPAFAAYRDAALPCAERLCRSHIALPLYPSMTDEQARYAAAALAEVVG